MINGMLDVCVDGLLESIYPGLAVLASAGNRERVSVLVRVRCDDAGSGECMDGASVFL